MNRMPWHKYYLGIAEAAAKRSGCVRSQVGAVVWSPDHLAFFGYNGTKESGQPECFQGGCPRGQKSYEELPPGGDYGNCTYVHAERNAIERAMKTLGVADLYGWGIAVTRAPCIDCMSLILSAKILTVTWGKP